MMTYNDSLHACDNKSVGINVCGLAYQDLSSEWLCSISSEWQTVQCRAPPQSWRVGQPEPAGESTDDVSHVTKVTNNLLLIRI